MLCVQLQEQAFLSTMTFYFIAIKDIFIRLQTM
uniref:Uncharacterized protein n=1 Tax=Parascaris equorum TaxID=6256 RepID=A0A914R7T6_PAREQ